MSLLLFFGVGGASCVAVRATCVEGLEERGRSKQVVKSNDVTFSSEGLDELWDVLADLGTFSRDGVNPDKVGFF